LDGSLRFLERDRDSKFTPAFDEVFRSAASEVIRTPVQAPRANAYAERWVRTVRTECLDWLLILNRRHLERVLRVYVRHYNHQRPRRGLKLATPEGLRQLEPVASDARAKVCRRDLLGGLDRCRDLQQSELHDSEAWRSRPDLIRADDFAVPLFGPPTH